MAETRICIVLYDRDSRPDAMLRQAVRRLRAGGIRVGGLLQEGLGGTASRCAALVLEDIGTGRRTQIFDERRAGARGCRLDPSGLAEAGGWLREAIDARPDVLFVNRFGRQEAEGRGLRDEIAAAVGAGIPVVVAVGTAILAEWRAFAGDDAADVAVGCDEIEAWCRRQAAEAVSR